MHRLPDIILTILNPWVALGILFLLGFFAAYMTALSWADLTYVLPATSLGYVLLALIAKFLLHEQVTHHALAGYRAMISAGVGFVTQGPALTPPMPTTTGVVLSPSASRVEPMKHAYTWGAILAIVLASTTGDVLLSRAMKRVGDVGELWRRSGLLTVAAASCAVPVFCWGFS